MRVKITLREQRARVSLGLLSLRKKGDYSLSSFGSVSADQPTLQTAQALPKPRLDHWYIQVTGFQCLRSRLDLFQHVLPVFLGLFLSSKLLVPWQLLLSDFGRPPKILRLTFPLIFCPYIKQTDRFIT